MGFTGVSTLNELQEHVHVDTKHMKKNSFISFILFIIMVEKIYPSSASFSILSRLIFDTLESSNLIQVSFGPYNSVVMSGTRIQLFGSVFDESIQMINITRFRLFDGVIV